MKEAKERGRNAPLGEGGGGESVGRVLGESLLVEGSLEVLESKSDYCGEKVSSLRRRRAKTRGARSQFKTVGSMLALPPEEEAPSLLRLARGAARAREAVARVARMEVRMLKELEPRL